jgi:hypothetical protein
MSNPASINTYVPPAAQAAQNESGLTVARPGLASVREVPYVAPEDEAPRERPMYLRSAAQSAPQADPSNPFMPAQAAPVAPAAAPTIEAVTFTNAQGRPLHHYMAGPNDRVMIGDMPTTVANALQLGLIREDKAEGGYKLTAEGIAQVGQEQDQRRAIHVAGQEEERAFTQATALREDIGQLHSRMQADVPSDVLARAFTEVGGDGDLSPGTISELSRWMGVSEQKAHAQALLINEALSAQAAAAFAHEGITEAAVEGFEGWAKATRSAELREAQMRHLHGSDLEGYRKLAKEYLRVSRGTREASYRTAQVDPRLRPRVINGKAVVTVPGAGEMTVEMALKLGLISAGR